jgi:tRNA U34 5-carboxymethylaminomethyl modifying enzyme MnmG/GidA
MLEEVNFESLNMNITPFVKNYPKELQREIFEYLSGLDEIDRKGYQIAYDHLGTSFNIARSNGFKTWQSKKST